MKGLSFIKSSSGRTQKAQKNILGMLLIKICNIIINLAYVPLLINSLNQDRYGIWLTITTIVSWYTRQKGLKRLPLAIPDREMNIFMLVTSSGEQGMEYFGEDNSKFQQGERVRVIDGKFKGAEGVICRIRKNRRLVVTVQGVCAVATSYIPQAFLQRIGQD